MDNLKKVGMKYIDFKLKQIESFRNDGEIALAFNIYHEVEGAIDMLHTLDLISGDEAILLKNKSLEVVSVLQDYENEISL